VAENTHTDLTVDKPINYAACAYRDYCAGVLTRTAAALIIKTNIRLVSDVDAYAVIDAEPGSDALAYALCLRDGWDHHDQTDDYPCAGCRDDAAILTGAVTV
jgi:hypothetical protein